ncbi:hypothetical protein DASC09_057150 [Saccharomycopsis crataegensis]|uniref:Uncharacterized protein n=1 Tax=Saccharomycopsis crataegensis TaxID=43959 RepID=A0AAV5QV30_9ASCO|nr:hypothetical protein DASC09_057150 [Saccharomycopsis crataegensis]
MVPPLPVNHDGSPQYDMSNSDTSESYRYLSNEETELETNLATAATFADLSFIRHGAQVLDNWDTNDSRPNNMDATTDNTKLKSGESVNDDKGSHSSNIKPNNIHKRRDSGSSAKYQADSEKSVVEDKYDESLNLNATAEYSPSVAKKDRKYQKKKNKNSYQLNDPNDTTLNNKENNDPSLIMHSTPLIKPSVVDSYPESILKKSGASNNGKRNVSFSLQQSFLPSKENEKDAHPIDMLKLRQLAPSDSTTKNVLNDNPRDNEIETLSHEIETLRRKLEQKQLQLKQVGIEKKLEEKNASNNGRKAISIDTVPTLGKIDAITGRSVYESLDFPDIDELSQIEAHNILKNICLKLEVPFSVLPKTVVNIPDLCKSESHLLNFASGIHKILYLSHLRVPIIEPIPFQENRMKIIGIGSGVTKKSKINFLKCLNHMQEEIYAMNNYINKVE